MKILFISPHSPFISIGGVERHIRNLMEYCRQNACGAIFLLPAPNGKESRKDEGGITVIEKEFLNFHHKKLFNKKEIPREQLGQKSREFFAFLQEILEKEKIEIVDVQDFHVGLPPIYSLLLNTACFLQKIPMVLTMHTFIGAGLQNSIINDLSWEKISCVSKSVSGDCFSKGVLIDRLHTQYLGVNTKEFKLNKDKLWLKKKLGLPEGVKIVLHASRVIDLDRDILKEKGLVALLEAFAPIFLKDKNTRLVIAVAVPPRNLRNEFNAAIEKLKGYIQLHNIVDGVVIKEFSLKDMPLVYSGADVFVLASENETFGQVYLEAMACSVPVIGTNIGGVPEIITDGFNGFLTEADNSSLLAQKIETLLSGDEPRKTFIKNGLKTARTKFSMQRQFKAMFSYFDKIVRGNNGIKNEIAKSNLQ